MKSKHSVFLWTAGIAALITVSVLSLCLGNIPISLKDIFGYFSGEDSYASNILKLSRIPRTLAALLSGAALAASGAILQNVLFNHLASPGIIGVNAGASFGVTLCSALGILSGCAVSAFAFLGSLAAITVISVFANKTNASKTTVILGGVALNSILGAMSESVAVLDPDISMLTAEFRVGGFSAVSHTRLFPAAVLIILSLILAFTLCNELDVLSLGDETAESVGLPAKRFRILFLVIAALLAGSAVSFTGLLGFVGLIVPHFIRKLAGSEASKLLPLTVIYGAVFVCACDLISRLIFSPFELPVGIIISVIGGPLFIFLLIKMKGGHSNA